VPTYSINEYIISHLISFKAIDLYTSMHFFSPVGLNPGCHARYTAYQVFKIEVHVNPTKLMVHSQPNSVTLWDASQISRDLMTLHMNSRYSTGTHSVDTSDDLTHEF